MTIDALKAQMPDFAKDVKLNLSNISGEEALSDQQKYGLMVACAIASRNDTVKAAFLAEATDKLSAEALAAAKGAATLMGMNNIYYRFVHMASNKEYGTLPAKLRMNFIARPGVDKVDFELWSLAVSAINGCGMCIDSHENTLRQHGVTSEQVQIAIRFAAIIQSAAIALEANA
ncbi:MAG: carboxymuconolactone decarboxylase family protein [Cohaesibacter sp.]|nr:carboxymuconolactone decarboxylase family protein [Cohaesibacter sp.]MCV6601993.1 carboxymuconolactone decarboxylase family protein [Cohaesibacter sp.]